MTEIKTPKKLIEVALPLDEISAGCEQEKNPFLKGHPRSMHLWWARRPLAAARAVIFSQLVNDPGWDNKLKRGLKKKEAAAERERLFEIIKKLVQWSNINNDEVLSEAREEIRKSWREICELNKDHPQAKELFDPEKLPAFHDPFAGGGAIPLEALRLGLESYASDLNPVAVTINRAMIEIPPKFSGQHPVGPISENETKQTKLIEEWRGTKGLAEDVRRYGAWMRAEAEKRIGHLYPKVEITEEIAQDRPDLKHLVGLKFPVIAWLWARTVKSPNPAFSHVSVPLASTFILSNKKGKEAYVEPIVKNDEYRFFVRTGPIPESATNGTKLSRGANFSCLLSGSPIEPSYIKEEGCSGRMATRLMAIVIDGGRKRIYLPPIKLHEQVANSVTPEWRPEIQLPDDPRNFWTLNYGLTNYGDLFTNRQLVAINELSKLALEAVNKARIDAITYGLPDDNITLESGGVGALAYAQAIGIYLAFSITHLTRYYCALCGWNRSNENVAQAFGRQAIPMVWDFAESNPIDGSLDISATVDWPASAIPNISTLGFVQQADAQYQNISEKKVVSTDPPYYDNVSYSDLSDFFYVWLRRTLSSISPKLFSTIVAPKTDELIASPYRQGSKDLAELFFLNGMKKAIHNISNQAHPAFPVTIYYAFKQSETKNETGTSSTGWETFLEAVIDAGFVITGTWPMRTERTKGLKGHVNVLASSIVLVCRQRAKNAPQISRREFIRELNAALPDALDEMTRGGVNSPVAPVDLSQAIIGPGMAIFSKYSAVLEADGSPMSVRTALQLINRFMAEDDFDHDTQFCLHWFESIGWAEGKFGEADVLARAKGTSVEGVKESGVVEAGSGKVRLFKFTEYPQDWNPKKDQRTPIWEALHHMIRAIQSGGENVAGELLSHMPARAESMRQLAYRLYTLCERKGWAEDARAYNELITAWPQIEKESHVVGHVNTQVEMDL